jgi:hypothetical protein
MVPVVLARVMTLGWAEGITAVDLAAIDAAGHDRKALATRVLQMFLRHALRDGFFHADMHQGNLKVAPNGDIVALDFGIMGRIDEYTRRVYAEILYGFIRKDYRRVAEVHFEAGYVPADRDVGEFAQALRSVGEPIFGMDASRISMARLLAYLFEVTERFGMETRTELILLQRTMVVVEGVARSLDPEMNIWTVARPVVEEYIRENVGPKALVRDLARDRAGSGALRAAPAATGRSGAAVAGKPAACRDTVPLAGTFRPMRQAARRCWRLAVAHRRLALRLSKTAHRIGGICDAALHRQHDLTCVQLHLLDRGANRLRPRLDQVLAVPVLDRERVGSRRQHLVPAGRCRSIRTAHPKAGWGGAAPPNRRCRSRPVRADPRGPRGRLDGHRARRKGHRHLGRGLHADPAAQLSEPLGGVAVRKRLQKLIGAYLLLNPREGRQLGGVFRRFHRVQRVLVLQLRGEHLQKHLEIRRDDGLIIFGDRRRRPVAACRIGKDLHRRAFRSKSEVERGQSREAGRAHGRGPRGRPGAHLARHGPMARVGIPPVRDPMGSPPGFSSAPVPTGHWAHRDRSG